MYVATCCARPHGAASKNSSGCRITPQSSGAVLRLESRRSNHVYYSRDESYITDVLSLHGSVKDEGLASLFRSLIDCVCRVNDLCGCVDSEAIKQSVMNIESVVEKFASLCENKHMPSIFNKVFHIAHVSTRRLGDRLSYLRQASDLDQRSFKNRKDL